MDGAGLQLVVGILQTGPLHYASIICPLICMLCFSGVHTAIGDKWMNFEWGAGFFRLT
jgi:hypothetical protein